MKTSFQLKRAHLFFTVSQSQRHHVFAQRHYMETMFVDGFGDASVFLQQRLRGVLVVPEVFAGDQAVGVLQPGRHVVGFRGELEEVEGLLQVVEMLRRLVLQLLPLAFHLHDVLLDRRSAKALFTQNLLPALYGVLEKKE